MITILGLFFLALAAIGYASDALQGDESPAESKPDGMSALLFVLCLASALSHAGKRPSCDDEE